MPASGKYLLDTNIIIALLKGEQRVLDALKRAEEVFIPVIAAGELYFGAAKSGRPEANRAVIDQFVQGRPLLFCDRAVAREYGRVKSVLKTLGTPLPKNGIWIAAIALHYGLTLISRDEHFLQNSQIIAKSW